MGACVIKGRMRHMNRHKNEAETTNRARDHEERFLALLILHVHTIVS